MHHHFGVFGLFALSWTEIWLKKSKKNVSKPIFSFSPHKHICFELQNPKGDNVISNRKKLGAIYTSLCVEKYVPYVTEVYLAAKNWKISILILFLIIYPYMGAGHQIISSFLGNFGYKYQNSIIFDQKINIKNK